MLARPAQRHAGIAVHMRQLQVTALGARANLGTGKTDTLTAQHVSRGRPAVTGVPMAGAPWRGRASVFDLSALRPIGRRRVIRVLPWVET